MEERLTWNEICKRYPKQWVGLDEIEYDKKYNVISAIVRYHSIPYEEIEYNQIAKGDCETFYTAPVSIIDMGGLMNG